MEQSFTHTHTLNENKLSPHPLAQINHTNITLNERKQREESIQCDSIYINLKSQS